MKSLIPIFAALMLVSPLAQANSLKFEILMKGKDRYELVDRQTAKGKTSHTNVSFVVTAVIGNDHFISDGSLEMDEANTADLVDIGNDTLRIVSEDKKIDQTLVAEVRQGFFSGIKSIKISSEQISQLFSHLMAEKGQDLIPRLHLVQDGKSVDMNLHFSDYTCSRAESELTCDMDTKMTFEVEVK
ncbi:MAG: hypothetical protein BroJett040_05850 [Oligoflexia bacterium]|nr:MAG: hypothetical protein BroJett040_05850 [Oligoflexia bacterium]